MAINEFGRVDGNTVNFTVGDMPVGFLVETSIIAGSGSVTPASLAVPNGETASFVITPAAGFTISGVTGCGGSLSGNTYTTGPITAACQIDISFCEPATLSLTSAPGTNSQSICFNNSITNITYTVGGGATGATVSGLPDGVSGSFSGGVLTISGTPTQSGNFNYTVNTTGSAPCAETSAVGEITVNPLPEVNCPADFVVCTDDGVFDMMNLVTPMGSGGSFSGNAGVDGNNFNPSNAPVGPGMISYQFIDSNGCVNNCNFNIDVSPCFDVQGTVVWVDDNEVGIPTTDLEITGTMFRESITTNNGVFEFRLSQAGDFTITPTRIAAPLDGGVDIADIQAIQQHVTFLNRFTSPYRLIAADVSGDDVISTFDAALIGQSILNNTSATALFTENESWRFVPADYIFSDPENPWGYPQSIVINNLQADSLNVNFIGIKVGDVNALSNPSPGMRPNIPTRDLQDNLSWRLTDNHWAAPGELLEVKVKSGYFQDFASWQMALQFDASAVEFVEVLTDESALNLGSGNFGTYQAEEGQLRALWSHGSGKNVTLEEDAYVFTLVFRSLTHEGKISDFIWLEDAIIPARVYNQDFQLSGVELEFVEEEVVSVIDTHIEGFRLFQNRPNPFSHSTVIGFEIPQSASIVLQITDISGKLVESIEKDATTGYNEIRLDTEVPSGMYFYELITPYGNLVSRLVVE